MPEIVDFKDIDVRETVRRMKSGELFIYPTDTVYCLGCNALKQGAVANLRNIKGIDEKPLSVIAPNKRWIYSNLEVNRRSYIQTLPGPFTFILTMSGRCVAWNVNPGSGELGIRIPYHAFSRLVQKTGVPFIVTEANLPGKAPSREVKKIPKQLLRNVDFVIDDGFLPNHASTIIDLTGEMARIVKR